MANIRSSDPHQQQQRDEEGEQLLVFGYSCKLFRDDERALFIDRGSHLIPWMGDEKLRIDRYDGRGALHELAPHEAAADAFQWWSALSERERRLEQLLDHERYLALYSDEHDQRTLEEEEWKRLKQLETPSGGTSYNQTTFDYDSVPEAGAASSTDAPPAQQPPQHEQQPYVPPERLSLPVGIKLPEWQRHADIIERTADFVARKGPQMEILIRAKQSSNDQFGFLAYDDPLQPFFRHLVVMIKAGRYSITNHEQTDDQTNDSSTSQGSLSFSRSDIAPARAAEPVYRPAANCAYQLLVNNIRSRQTVTQPAASVVRAAAAAAATPAAAAAALQPTLAPSVSSHLPAAASGAAATAASGAAGSGATAAAGGGVGGDVHTCPVSSAVAAQSNLTINTEHDGCQRPHSASPTSDQLSVNTTTSTSCCPTSSSNSTLLQSQPMAAAEPGRARVAPATANSDSIRENNSDNSDNSDNSGGGGEGGGGGGGFQLTQFELPPAERRLNIDKVASYVAKNGRDFEAIVLARGDARFDFLGESHRYHDYYRQKLSFYECELAKSSADTSAANSTLAPVSFSIRARRQEEAAALEHKSALPLEESSEEEEESAAQVANGERVDEQPQVNATELINKWVARAGTSRSIVARQAATGVARHTARAHADSERLRQERRRRATLFMARMRGRAAATAAAASAGTAAATAAADATVATAGVVAVPNDSRLQTVAASTTIRSSRVSQSLPVYGPVYEPFLSPSPSPSPSGHHSLSSALSPSSLTHSSPVDPLVVTSSVAPSVGGGANYRAIVTTTAAAITSVNNKNSQDDEDSDDDDDGGLDKYRLVSDDSLDDTAAATATTTRDSSVTSPPEAATAAADPAAGSGNSVSPSLRGAIGASPTSSQAPSVEPPPPLDDERQSDCDGPRHQQVVTSDLEEGQCSSSSSTSGRSRASSARLRQSPVSGQREPVSDSDDAATSSTATAPVTASRVSEEKEEGERDVGAQREGSGVEHSDGGSVRPANGPHSTRSHSRPDVIGDEDACGGDGDGGLRRQRRSHKSKKKSKKRHHRHRSGSRSRHRSISPQSSRSRDVKKRRKSPEKDSKRSTHSYRHRSPIKETYSPIRHEKKSKKSKHKHSKRARLSSPETVRAAAAGSTRHGRSSRSRASAVRSQRSPGRRTTVPPVVSLSPLLDEEIIDLTSPVREASVTSLATITAAAPSPIVRVESSSGVSTPTSAHSVTSRVSVKSRLQDTLSAVASFSSANHTAGQTTGVVTAGQTTGVVTAGQTTGVVTAGQTTGAVTAGQTTGAVTAGQTTGAVTSGVSASSEVVARMSQNLKARLNELLSSSTLLKK